MDAKLADRIVGCRHHTASLRASAYDDRLSGEVRSVALLDRGIKGVHVDVDNHQAPIAIA